MIDRAQTETEKALEDALYTDRVLVFLEEDKGFRQVLLTKEQFKTVSDAMIVSRGPMDARGIEQVLVRTGKKLLKKEQFDQMSSYE